MISLYELLSDKTREGVAFVSAIKAQQPATRLLRPRHHRVPMARMPEILRQMTSSWGPSKMRRELRHRCSTRKTPKTVANRRLIFPAAAQAAKELHVVDHLVQLGLSKRQFGRKVTRIRVDHFEVARRTAAVSQIR
jgi:hypothetical protein